VQTKRINTAIHFALIIPYIKNGIAIMREMVSRFEMVHILQHCPLPNCVHGLNNSLNI
jgi:hypothetical protein